MLTDPRDLWIFHNKKVPYADKKILLSKYKQVKYKLKRYYISMCSEWFFCLSGRFKIGRISSKWVTHCVLSFIWNLNQNVTKRWIFFKYTITTCFLGTNIMDLKWLAREILLLPTPAPHPTSSHPLTSDNYFFLFFPVTCIMFEYERFFLFLFFFSLFLSLLWPSLSRFDWYQVKPVCYQENQNQTRIFIWEKLLEYSQILPLQQSLW